MTLVPVDKAQNLILRCALLRPVSTLKLPYTFGEVLAESVFADRDQPSADRASMDGIAISFRAWQAGYKTFRLCGVQRAGTACKRLQKQTDCFEIMTGAVLPVGTDTVIPIEHIILQNSQAIIHPKSAIKKNQCTRSQSSEYRQGKLLVCAGTHLQAPHIGILASVGKCLVKVYAQPRIAVIGTGDELVAVAKTPKAFQSRQSNTFALEALLRLNGFKHIQRFHLPDQRKTLTKKLQKILASFDVIVLSGGVSMGKFDFIPEVLQNLGVQCQFHKVAQRPGKPLWFGMTYHKQAVFGLPGNPVSTLVCARRYVVPYLHKSQGRTMLKDYVTASKKIIPDLKLTLFLPVKLISQSSVQIINSAGSGDYGALNCSEGFIEVPCGTQILKPKSRLRYFSW